MNYRVQDLASALGYKSASSIQGKNGGIWKKFITREPKRRAFVTEPDYNKALQLQRDIKTIREEFWMFMYFLIQEFNYTKRNRIDFVLDKCGLIGFTNAHTLYMVIEKESIGTLKITKAMKKLIHTKEYKEYQKFYTYDDEH